MEAHVDIIRIVKRIEFATNSRWWLLAALLIISCRWPVLAVLEIFLIAVDCWVFRYAEPDVEPVADEGGAA